MALTGVGDPEAALGAAGSAAIAAQGVGEVALGGFMMSNASKNLTNGNSKSSTKEQHNYDVVDTQNGDKTVKTGVSGGKETKGGESYSDKSQANKWNKQEGTPDRYKSKTTNRVPAGEGARQKALDYEANRASEVRSELDPNKHKRP